MHDYQATKLILEVGEMNFEGNVIPHTWYKHLTLDSGKPNLTAIVLLSEICYWYRPTYVRDEGTGQVKELRKKFKADFLQRSYQSLADQFGISKRQATDAIVFLEKKGVVKRHLRVVRSQQVVSSNVLFIELIPSKLKEFQKCVAYHVETGHPPHSNVTPPTFKCDTYTENTQEITQRNNNTSEKQEVEPVKVQDKTVVVFLGSLEEKISKRSIEILSSFSLDQIKQGLEAARQVENPDSFDATLITAVREGWKPKKSKESLREANKAFLEYCRNEDGKTIGGHQVRVTSDRVVFQPKGMLEAVEFLVDDKSFKPKIQAFIRKHK